MLFNRINPKEEKPNDTTLTETVDEVKIDLSRAVTEVEKVPEVADSKIPTPKNEELQKEETNKADEAKPQVVPALDVAAKQP